MALVFKAKNDFYMAFFFFSLKSEQQLMILI